MKLTDAQKDALRQLGERGRILAVIPTDVIQQLFGLGLLYKRQDGNLDCTDLGEKTIKGLLKGERENGKGNLQEL